MPVKHEHDRRRRHQHRRPARRRCRTPCGSRRRRRAELRPRRARAASACRGRRCGRRACRAAGAARARAAGSPCARTARGLRRGGGSRPGPRRRPPAAARAWSPRATSQRIGSPYWTVTFGNCSRCQLRTRWEPWIAIGTTGAPVSSARRPIPGLACSASLPVRERPPSQYIVIAPPRARIVSAVMKVSSSRAPRRTGKVPPRAKTTCIGGLNSCDLAMKWTLRRM